MLFVNEAVPASTGYTSEELNMMNIMDLHPEEKRKEVWDLFQCMMRGEIESSNFEILNRSGDTISFEVRVFLGRWNGEYSVFYIQ